jgi:ParB family chromosome partitioning protein
VEGEESAAGSANGAFDMQPSLSVIDPGDSAAAAHDERPSPDAGGGLDGSLPAVDQAGVSRDTPVLGQLVVELPLTSIRPSRHQPRRSFDPGALQELATSIAEHGRVLQPIVVRPLPAAADAEAARIELVAGERRWRASVLAGMASIRAVVEGVDDATSAQMALAENMARADLNPIEEARGCAALRDRFGLSVAQIARRVGRDRSAVSHLIRLLDLPDVALEQIATGTLSEGHGRVLLRLDDHCDRLEFARRCVRAGWSVRELERQVDARYAGTTAVRPRSADEAAMLEALADRLTPLFGPSPLQIVARRHGSYELQVGFHDLVALQSAIARLCEDTTT